MTCKELILLDIGSRVEINLHIGDKNYWIPAKLLKSYPSWTVNYAADVFLTEVPGIGKVEAVPHYYIRLFENWDHFR